ncbi:MAG: Peptidyl-tRNA hydrolase [Lentisphaerae bacterium ADurb.Bin242]|nr:MAG: Peptidyl-tRNA hydrolase [Lentisphaerae bacterium ADurb.Bin242]
MGSAGNDLGNCVLIAGLGNPGAEYAGTRHNIGFMVLDRLAEHLPKKNFEEVHGCSSRYLRGTYAGRPLFLQKPETFMNLSGEAVAALMRREEIDPRELLVVYDDMDLELGRLRIRERGSCGGHNGIRSIIEHLGTDSFPRLRVGIGHRKDGNGVDHVLSPFEPEEQAVLEKVLSAASDALILILRRGIKQAMNSYNPLDFSAEPGQTEEENR